MGLTVALGTAAFAQERDVDSWMELANFILGVYSAEDIIQIPGTRWIFGSSVTTQGPGKDYGHLKKSCLHLFNIDSETGSWIDGGQIHESLDAVRFPEKTAPPDWEVFRPHGIAVGAQDGDTVTFCAVSHGGCEAIEILEIDILG